MGETMDRLMIRYHYLRTVGCLPNLDNPASFTEKVQVAKLKWRSPRMVLLADKVEAKKVVAGQLGHEWVTPTLYAGPNLPPRSERRWPVPYVIKCNHRSGGNHFVHRPDPDWPKIERQIARQLARPYGRRLVEWAYTRITPQVLVEPFIGSGDAPPDYKLFLFGGKFAFTAMNWNRFGPGGVQRATFDRDWKRLPFVTSSYGDYDGPGVAALRHLVEHYQHVLDRADPVVDGVLELLGDFHDELVEVIVSLVVSFRMKLAMLFAAWAPSAAPLRATSRAAARSETATTPSMPRNCADAVSAGNSFAKSLSSEPPFLPAFAMASRARSASAAGICSRPLNGPRSTVKRHRRLNADWQTAAPKAPPA